MPRFLSASLLAVGLMLCVGCDESSADTDAGPDCSSPALGCACDTPAEVMCRVPGPDLRCTGGVWMPSADGPCGLDAGAP